jgi:hypothetical protein
MGMFDELNVKHDLPLPEEIKNLDIDWKEVRFQTKDLENLMDDYLIENNALYQRIVELEYVEFTEEEKKQNKKKKKWFPFYKDVIEKSSYHKKIDDFHGSINFYHYGEIDDKKDFMIDFTAHFIYGNLDKIEFLRFEKFESRKINSEKWKIEMEEEAKKPWNRFKRYANYVGWRFFWKTVDKTIYKIEKLFQSVRTFIIRHML